LAAAGDGWRRCAAHHGGWGSVQANSQNTITAVNKFSLKPNEALNVKFRFKPGTLRIAKGERLTFQQGPVVPDVFPPDPHTLSIVGRDDVPRTITWSTPASLA
jgi:hypothetical protein